MKNNDKIPADPEALKARLNQPRLTRVEMLKQLQATMPLEPHALRELQQSNSASSNGANKSAT